LQISKCGSQIEVNFKSRTRELIEELEAVNGDSGRLKLKTGEWKLGCRGMFKRRYATRGLSCAENRGINPTATINYRYAICEEGTPTVNHRYAIRGSCVADARGVAEEGYVRG
jgi:hypothetical protein